jgi:hypothetical protein
VASSLLSDLPRHSSGDNTTKLLRAVHAGAPTENRCTQNTKLVRLPFKLLNIISAAYPHQGGVGIIQPHYVEGLQ